jgi:hypothetical protein
VNCLSLSSYGSADLSSPGSVAWGSSAGESDRCCGRLLNVVGHLGLHQSGLTSTCFTDCPSLGPRRNGLTIYWALGPLVRSFTLPVDPGDICPPHSPTTIILWGAYLCPLVGQMEWVEHKKPIPSIETHFEELHHTSAKENHLVISIGTLRSA